MIRYFVRNKTKTPFNYNGQIIGVTGSLLLFEDEIDGLGHHIHKGHIEVMGVEQIKDKDKDENKDDIINVKSSSKKRKIKKENKGGLI